MIRNGVAYSFESNRLGTTFIHIEIQDVSGVYRPVASYEGDEAEWKYILSHDPIAEDHRLEGGVRIRQMVSVDVLVSRIRDEVKKNGGDDPGYWPVRNGVLDANGCVEYGNEWNDITYLDDDVKAFASDYLQDKEDEEE